MKKNIKSLVAVFLSTYLMIIGVMNVSAENSLFEFNSFSNSINNQNTLSTDISNYQIKIDDKIIDNAKAFVGTYSVMLPVRIVAEEMGFTVRWNDNQKKIEQN